MPRGDKSKYTDKQKRQTEHIEEGYERRGAFTSRETTSPPSVAEACINSLFSCLCDRPGCFGP